MTANNGPAIEHAALGEVPQSYLELGVIGHEDVQDAYQIGSDGGPILARVQLLRGRDYTQPLKKDRYQGHEILARVRSGVSGLPPKGTEVLVAFPRGMEDAPGAAVIIAELSRVESNAVYGSMKEEELCIHPGNADAKARLLMKANNTISFYTLDGDGKPVSVILDAATGNVTLISKHGAIAMSSTGISMIAGQSGIQLGSDGNVSINCNVLTVNGKKTALNTGSVMLGPFNGTPPTSVQAALHGTAGPSGVPSATVFVAL